MLATTQLKYVRRVVNSSDQKRLWCEQSVSLTLKDSVCITANLAHFFSHLTRLMTKLAVKVLPTSGLLCAGFTNLMLHACCCQLISCNQLVNSSIQCTLTPIPLKQKILMSLTNVSYGKEKASYNRFTFSQHVLPLFVLYQVTFFP